MFSSYVYGLVFVCRSLRTGCHLEDDDIVTELVHIHPRERPDWEETISAMVRSCFLKNPLTFSFFHLSIHICSHPRGNGCCSALVGGAHVMQQRCCPCVSLKRQQGSRRFLLSKS